jgi:hypothetical protein
MAYEAAQQTPLLQPRHTDSRLALSDIKICRHSSSQTLLNVFTMRFTTLVAFLSLVLAVPNLSLESFVQ